MPGWISSAFADFPIGFAYQDDGLNLHLFGSGPPFWTLHPGIAFWDDVTGTLEDWAVTTFVASNPVPVAHSAGTATRGVWRPGLGDEAARRQVLGYQLAERRGAEQSVLLLVDRLRDIFLTLEPTGPGLRAYGPRTRELLLLACTEVEAYWAYYMRLAGESSSARGWTTSDYARLCEPLHLREYRIELQPYPGAPRVRPFFGWDVAAPTRSLGWYDAYNRAKHDARVNASAATVEACIEAVAAVLALFCSRFSPTSLFEPTALGSWITQLFSIELVDPPLSSFYVPLVDAPAITRRGGLQHGDLQRSVQPWTVLPLAI